MNRNQLLLAALFAPLLCLSQPQDKPVGQDHYNNGLLELSVAHDEPTIREKQAMVANGRVWHGGFLAITLKNISGEDVVIGQTSASQFEFEVADVDGKEVPLTPAGEKERATRHTRLRNPALAYSTALHPGQETTMRLDVSRLFQIFPGEVYHVTVRRSDGLRARRQNREKLEQELSRTFTITGHEDL